MQCRGNDLQSFLPDFACNRRPFALEDRIETPYRQSGGRRHLVPVQLRIVNAARNAAACPEQDLTIERRKRQLALAAARQPGRHKVQKCFLKR